MVDRTHYYGSIADAFMRGRHTPAPQIIDPVLGMYVEVASPPGVAVTVNCCMRGNTSGAAGIVRMVISQTRFVIEMLPNSVAAPPLDLPGLGFAQNNAGPFTGETVTFDNGGTSTISVLANAQNVPGTSQLSSVLKDRDYTDATPSDYSDTPYWDAHCKVAQSIVVGTLTGTSPYFRKGDRCTTASGAFTVLKVSGSGTTRTLLIIRKTGSISTTQVATNTTLGGGTTGTITTITADEPLGIWVPWQPLPNLGGNADSYEFPPNGNGTDGKEPGLGIEHRLLPLMHAYHQANPVPTDRGWRFMQFSSFDDPEGFSNGALGGVVVQVVQCSGTFPASGVLAIGETVTGPGGWSATVYGFNNTSKFLFVHKTNGATLGAGTLTCSGGATVTGIGAANGWQKGSSHWNAWKTMKDTALSRGVSTASQGALFGGAAAYWEGLILAPWQTELGVHGPTVAAPFPTAPQAADAWAKWIGDLRTELGRADLPITVWSHLPTSYSSTSFFGVPWSYVQREFLRAIPSNVARVTVTDSYALQCQGAQDSDLYLRTLDTSEILGPALWRHLRFGQVVVVPGSGFTPLPIGFHFGQSNETGNITATTAIAFDSDPDLWPIPHFSGSLSTVDPNLLSFNQVTEQLEPASLDINFNGSWGTFQGTCGGEVATVQRMKMRFSNDATASAKFAFFKYTVPGSNVNKLVPVGSGTWDPTLSARPLVSASATVSLFAASGSVPARARFTAAAGTYSTSVFSVQMSCKIGGSLLGNQGTGGNNSPPYTVQGVYAIAVDGSWIEFVGGGFVVETATFQILAGPPPIWPELVSKVGKFFAACRDKGYVPVPRYIAWGQGEGDLQRLGEYEVALRAFWSALISLCSMRLKGDEPIAKCTFLTPSTTGYNAPDADIATLRDIQARVPAEFGNTVVVETSDLSLNLAPNGAWPRVTRFDNDLHFTGRALVTRGFRCDAALATLGPSKGIPAHPKGELAVDFGAVNGGVGTGSSADFGGGGDSVGSGSDAAAAQESSPTDIVAAIDQAIADGGDVAAYTVNGRFVQLRSLGELIAARRFYAAQAAKARGLRSTRVRFNE